MSRVLRSSAATFATGYVLLGFTALVLFAAPLRYAWQATVEDFRFEILQEDSDRLAHVYELRGPAGLSSFIEERVGMQIAGERMLLLSDAAGRPLAGNLPGWPQSIPARAGSYTLPVTLDGRRVMVAMVLTALPDGYRLLVGRDIDRFAPIQRRFWYGLAAAVAVLTVAGLIGAVLIRRALLARIHSTQQTVAAIMRGDLSHRLTVRSSGDELDTLAQTINRLLEQIEQLVHGIANVSNSIAHDLRTPLAELRSRLEELALTRPPSEEVFAEIDAAVADVDGVIRIFNALLRLAEIDAGLRRSNFVTTDLAELAAKAVEFYLPAAELKGLSLSFRDPGPANARCDAVLLAQAINNLIDNSLKFVTAGGHIEVAVVRPTEDSVAVMVADDGPGMPEADRSQATQRFFRGDASRGTPGVGLGLSLVEAIARLHGGSLELTDNHPGLLARMIIERGAAIATAPPEPQRIDPDRPPQDVEITA
ncbi:MAG TPA: HAMP domain-containing sensor histidine kinase [Steroidobacteraceae bacterium]|jgi:signal transduction histidine kinase|nr:HAMP domain-containing sensor histidine kinase [Steroidobacteraceae bacterium]